MESFLVCVAVLGRVLDFFFHQSSLYTAKAMGIPIERVAESRECMRCVRNRIDFTQGNFMLRATWRFFSCYRRGIVCFCGTCVGLHFYNVLKGSVYLTMFIINPEETLEA